MTRPRIPTSAASTVVQLRAAAAGVPYALSTMGAVSPERLSQAGGNDGADRWFPLHLGLHVQSPTPAISQLEAIADHSLGAPIPSSPDAIVDCPFGQFRALWAVLGSGVRSRALGVLAWAQPVAGLSG